MSDTTDPTPPESSTPSESSTPQNSSLPPEQEQPEIAALTTRGARKRSVRRDAALRSYQRDRSRAGGSTAAGTSVPRWVTLGSGVAVLGLIAGVVTAGTLLAPEPVVVNTSASPAQLPATISHAVCAPAPRLPAGAGEGTDIEFSPISSDATTTLTVAAASDLAGKLPGMTQLSAEGEDVAGNEIELTPSQPDEVQQGAPATSGADGVPVHEAIVHRTTGQTSGDGAPVILTAEPLGGAPAQASGVMEFAASDGDLHGYAASSCFPPSHHQWVSGASTQVGTTSVLTITNPTLTGATVDLTLYGATGQLEAAGTRGLVIGPQQTRSFVLGGLAPDEESVTVHARSLGGHIAASIQQHTLSGIDPLGVEVLQPSVAPANSAVIPGVTVEEGVTELHLTAPDRPVTVEVEVRGAEGAVATEILTVDGAQRFTLDELEPGTYSIALSSDAPVVASAQSETTAGGVGPDREIAAVPATSALRFKQMVALGAAESQLILTSGADASVEVLAFDNAGDPLDPMTVDIAAGTTQAVELEGAASAQISTSGRSVHAAVTVNAETGISGYPVHPATSSASGVPVRIGW